MNMHNHGVVQAATGDCRPAVLQQQHNRLPTTLLRSHHCHAFYCFAAALIQVLVTV
jgi:hypothetical protein